MTDVQDRAVSAQDQTEEALQRFVDGVSILLPPPSCTHRPSTAPSTRTDEVPGKLIIANHPMGFSRSGMPANLHPWKADWAANGGSHHERGHPDSPAKAG
jgi:hypothetical protein